MRAASPSLKLRSRWRSADILIPLLPLGLAWVVILSLYVHGGLLLGHWPRPNTDDPKDLALGVHYSVAGYAVLCCAVWTMALLVYAPLRLLLDRRNRATSWVVLAGAVLSVILWLAPPVGWYLD